MQGIKNIVLVHGAWADGSSWTKVLTVETGSERVTVDFPGRNKRATFSPERVVVKTTET